MRAWWQVVTSKPEAVGFAIFAGAAALTAIVPLWRWFRRSPDADEVERRRRDTLVRNGKMGDAEILEVEDASIVYSYHVRGVGYTASQDITSLQSLLPEDRMKMIGAVSIRFDPRNPANSIVLSERWSGLRTSR
jgi:hypothetical protein